MSEAGNAEGRSETGPGARRPPEIPEVRGECCCFENLRFLSYVSVRQVLSLEVDLIHHRCLREGLEQCRPAQLVLPGVLQPRRAALVGRLGVVHDPVANGLDLPGER